MIGMEISGSVLLSMESNIFFFSFKLSTYSYGIVIRTEWCVTF